MDIQFTLNTLTIDELRQRVEGKTNRWAVEGLLPLPSLTIVAGESKGGKTTLVAGLAVAVSRGEPWLGMPTRKGPVLWIAAEEASEELAFAFGPYEGPLSDIHAFCGKPRIDRPDGIAAAERKILEIEPTLVVVDCLTAAVEDPDMDHGKPGRDKLAGLKELVDRSGVACLVVHHMSKGGSRGFDSRQRVSNSNQLLATASGDWVIESRAEGNGWTYVIHVTARVVGRRTLAARSSRPGEFSTVEPGERRKRVSEARAKIAKCLTETEGTSQSQIIKATGLSRGSVSTQLRELESAGHVVREAPPKRDALGDRQHRFRLVAPKHEPQAPSTSDKGEDEASAELGGKGVPRPAW